MPDAILKQFQEDSDKVLEHLQHEFSGLQIGRASAALVEGIEVEAYGTKQPLKTIANVSVPDPKTVQIQPWDKSQLGPIEKAIQNSDLNIAPVNDGAVVRLVIPPLTEERRKDLTKVVHRLAEEARIAIRNARQKGHDKAREMEKSSDITEDQLRGFEKKLQQHVDDMNSKVEESAKKKEQDIMTV